MTLGDFIPDVRRLVRDTNASLYHYDDGTVLHAVVDGVEALRAQRPESRYVENDIEDIVYPSTSSALAALDANVPRRWRLGVCYFAAGRVLETDTVDTVNAQLSAEMFKKAQVEFMR